MHNIADRIIANKPLHAWIKEHPLLQKIIHKDEVFWLNPLYKMFESAQSTISLSQVHINDAEERFNRFAPYISRVFPETQHTGGIIESPLKTISVIKSRLSKQFNNEISGQLLLKCDNQLAIAGSIKARGGIYEVLKHAEDLALQHSLISTKDDYSIFDSDKFKQFFSQYSIAVGSTGNLGLSIGIMGSQLGFQVFVHMSSDAKKWKKDLLREKGVTVIKYESDYSRAVDEGRKQANRDNRIHFIDDENSSDLFLGYAVAASRLTRQLTDCNISVDKEHPLFVYIPCGVGGGPGGITFGLKQIFRDNVHCFFAEPTSSPCMLLGLMTRLHNQISVYDFGLDNITDADGLAVARPSALVGKTLEQMISGIYTVNDTTLYKLLCMLSDTEHISLEPSAVAGMPGPFLLFNTTEGRRYIEQNGLYQHMPDSTHIVWATGGYLIPADIMEVYYRKGARYK